MSQLGSLSVSSELLKTLWLQRLPTTMQSILATSEDSLPNLARMADKISEIEQPQTYAVSSDAVNKNMAETIKQLTEEIAELKSSFRKQQRSTSKNRSRSHNRSRDPPDTRACWYHRKFNEKAKKCVAPCKYNSKNNTTSENN